MNKKITRVELEMFVDQMKDLLPAQLQMHNPQAKAMKSKYDSLLAEGFTEEQALEIVKTRPIFE